jgi:pimeloyl-ACP methyl ester carboxylesterase
MTSADSIDHAVLVHGSFSSERSWDPILDGLRTGGMTPHPICLPGHGRRGDESAPEIDLHAHARAIVEHVEANDLQRVLLAGHSYGGMPMTQAWDKLRDRVAAVVYVDAGVPVDGQCQLDMLDEELADMTRNIAADNGDMLPAPTRNLQTWPLSIAALTTPLHLTQPLPAGVPRTLVLATENPGYHHAQASGLRGRPDWTVIDVATGHNVISEHPQFLVDTLLTIAHHQT